MYSKGVLKILSVPTGYGHIDNLKKMADATTHDAIEHNGIIFVRGTGNTWIETCFTLDDFSNEPN